MDNFNEIIPNPKINALTKLENGRKNGPYKEYYEMYFNVKCEGQYLDDLETGQWEFFRPDKTRHSLGSYHKGKKVGTWIFYNENDERYLDVSYEQNVKQGVIVEYYPNRQIHKIGMYQDDEPDGIFYTYYQSEESFSHFSKMNKGKIKEVHFYEMGFLSGMKRFDQNGILVECNGEDPEQFVSYDSNGMITQIQKFMNMLNNEDYEEKVNFEIISKYEKGIRRFEAKYDLLTGKLLQKVFHM